MAINGIDISSWQKGLKIADVKKAGYDFVILRGGFTGYGEGRQKNKDSTFEDFYAQCKAAGMPCGVYWFSCANDEAEGRKEAAFLYENCLKGKQFEYPIYIDVEDTHWQANDKAGVTDAIIAFCDTLEKLGYFVGVYASKSWFETKIDTGRLNKYTKWVAAWRAGKPSFAWPAFDLWQYTSKATVRGMTVDADEVYRDFPFIIKNGGFNGFKKAVVVKKGYSGTFLTIKVNTSLRNGSKGEQVKRLQAFLNWYNGNNALAVDGLFGPKTEAAVKAFQKAQKLTVDGKFGVKSLAAAKAVKK